MKAIVVSCAFLVGLVCSSFFLSTWLLAAEESVPLARDGMQLSRACKAWTYPKDNDLTITRSIGRHNPIHIISTTSADSFETICDYYADKCGHDELGSEDYMASGTSEGALYLIRSFPSESGTSTPRMIFLHHGFEHTVTVNVIAPADSPVRHIDVSVSVR